MIFRHQNPGGGGGSPTNLGGDPPAPGQGAKAPGTGEPGGAGGGQIDYKAKFEELEPRHKTLEAEHKARGEQFGKQSSELGELRKLKDELAGDPRDHVRKYAERRGVKLKFDDEAGGDLDTLRKNLDSDDPDVRKAASTKLEAAVVANLREKVMGDLNPTLKAMRDQALSQKYQDYETLSPARKDLGDGVAAGMMSTEEVLHYAARGFKIDEAVNAAVERGRKAREEEIYAEIRAAGSSAGQRENADDPNNPASKARANTENALKLAGMRGKPLVTVTQ